MPGKVFWIAPGVSPVVFILMSWWIHGSLLLISYWSCSFFFLDASKEGDPGVDERHIILYQEMNRFISIHLPDGYSGSEALLLLIAFHGAGPMPAPLGPLISEPMAQACSQSARSPRSVTWNSGWSPWVASGKYRFALYTHWILSVRSIAPVNR